MLQNATKCDVGMLFCNDIIQNSEQRSRKKESKEKNSLPDESNVLVHAV